MMPICQMGISQIGMSMQVSKSNLPYLLSVGRQDKPLIHRSGKAEKSLVFNVVGSEADCLGNQPETSSNTLTVYVSAPC